MIHARAIDAIEASDTDELLRIIDQLCAAQSWDGLAELRTRCRDAIGRGKQLWGVEEHIRYRLALQAPAEIAGPVVSEGEARFALGPLAEVAASTKSWRDLEPHLDNGPWRASVAAERVVRGESLSLDGLDLPAQLQPWEPAYPVATYHSDHVDTPSPDLPSMSDAPLPQRVDTIEDVASESALADLVLPWTDESNGRCQTVTASGDHLAAIKALGPGTARVGALGTKLAMQWLAWAGASGGAHGRRRGAAAGRYLAWWVVANLADLDWPAAGDELGRAAESLAWHWFDDGSPDTGWVLRISVADRNGGLAWAISATDGV